MQIPIDTNLGVENFATNHSSLLKASFQNFFVLKHLKTLIFLKFDFRSWFYVKYVSRCLESQKLNSSKHREVVDILYFG